MFVRVLYALLQKRDVISSQAFIPHLLKGLLASDACPHHNDYPKPSDFYAGIRPGLPP